MATKKRNNNYNKGAQFERDMADHMKGTFDKKTGARLTWGWVHHTVVEILVGVVAKDVVLSHLKVWANRTPGSKGQGHVDVACLITLGAKQIGVGIQCKTSKYQSYAEIQEEIDAIREEGWIPAFAFKDGSSFKWHLSLEEKIRSILLNLKEDDNGE